MEKKRKKFDAKCEILFGALILALIIGLSAVTYADSFDNPLSVDPSFLDPFEFKSVSYLADVNLSEEVAGALFSDDYNRQSSIGHVWMPRRAVCRSSIRPDWTP